MGYKCGIVGLPNVGKSTLFNLLTNSQIAKAENFPFCTIECNKANVPYVDKRIDKLAIMNKSKVKYYSSLEVVDIAGLIEGASKGEGLGNKFLSHIREVDAIFHVVRCFYNDDIMHVRDEINPIKDFEIICTELAIADLNSIENMKKKQKDPKILEEINIIEKAILSGEQMILDNPEYQFLSLKPRIIVINGDPVVDIDLINEVKQYCDQKNIRYIVFPIVSDNYDDHQEENIRNLIKIGFELLHLISFFTSGEVETRAWTITDQTKASDAAGKIHSSFSKHFISAEVIPYESYITGNKKFNREGRDYIVKDGDIILFKHNAK